MKYNLIILVFALGMMQTLAQHNKKISLEGLDDQLYMDIKLQGEKLFIKSPCQDNTEKSVVIPQFYVESLISLDSLYFDDPNFLMKNLYFKRSSKRKFITDISWQVIDLKDNDKFSSSDHKRFYCYDAPPGAFDYVFLSIRKIGIDSIKYFFYIGRTNGFVQFIVDIDNNIYVYHSSEQTWFDLKQFSKFYEKNESEKFSDNLFEK